MRNTLICTVGTSFLGNVGRLDASHPVRQAKESKNWKQLSLKLLKTQNTDRLCGAEINSITSICKENLLSSRDRLIFLLSDTEDGQIIGDILGHYYNLSGNPLRFETVEKRVVKGLRDDNVDAFQREGLKNLVIEISQEVRKFSPDTIAINATGGYKAQISFAGMIGQALVIPVYYLFERFSKVIQLPPQPVALDLGLWLAHYDLFEALELEQQIEEKDLEPEKLELSGLNIIFDREEVNGTRFVALSAMGQLFHERCRLQFPQQQTVLLSHIPKDDTSFDKKRIDLRDDHGNDILLPFAKRLCKSPYVKEVLNSLPFNPKRRNCIRRARPDGIVEFVLNWTDAGIGLCVLTTGRTLAEVNTIALHLKDKYGQ
jgi:putative CRISPR-associated protein (TIGR02619 family)